MEQICLDDYLHRRYENERECEYVDGLLEERTGGDVAHGLMHVEAGAWFCRHRKEWDLHVLMSYSMWTSPTRIRIPDLVILSDRLDEDIRVTPPLLCIEILAPEDHPSRLLPRLEDMLGMGARHLWLIDPIAHTAFTYTADGLKLVHTPRLTLPDSPIYLDLPELFAGLR